MKTKMFYGNQFIGAFDCDGRKYSKWQIRWFKTKRMVKRVVLTSGALSALGWAFVAGANYLPHIVHSQVPVEVKVPVTYKDIPMLNHICNAESNGQQFEKNGDVKRGVIDKSDIGKCQINERYNNDEARRLGYDIYTEKGNEDYAVYLYLHRGVQPWLASMCIPNGWGTKSECGK